VLPVPWLLFKIFEYLDIRYWLYIDQYWYPSVTVVHACFLLCVLRGYSWVSGITYVYSPYVWSCCLRYLHNAAIQDRWDHNNNNNNSNDNNKHHLFYEGCITKIYIFFSTWCSKQQIMENITTHTQTKHHEASIQCNEKFR